VHPYCTVTVVIVPIDEDGKPQAAQTVTLSGTAGIFIDSEEAMIKWRPDPETGTAFTLTGSATQI
jgi:hypothetical protein